MKKLWHRLRVLFARERFDADLAEEMALHLEMAAEERRQAGASDDEARLAARRQFGNPALLRDESRDQWGWYWLETIGQDIRLAARLMRHNPVFTAIAVITLALGIGANTAVFSLLDAVVLHPLPYARPNQLYLLWTVEGRSQRAHHSSYPDFLEWRQAHGFESMAAFHGASFNVTGGTDAERIFGIAATSGLLEVLGIHPAVGRSISPADGRRVAIITDRLWSTRFGRNNGIVGQSIRLDGEDYTVLGVLPANFHFQPRFSTEPDVIVPMEPVPYRTSWFLRVVGRLRDGVSEQQAQAEMSAIAARIVQANPELDKRQGVRVDPMHRYVVQDARTTALLLAGAVGFLLIIACANVANLFLARGAGRERELAVRVALGASRLRLLRQLLTESLATALLGGMLGLGLAYVSLPLIAAMAPEWTSFFSRIQDNGLHLNFPVLGFTAAMCLVATVLFGALPAARCSRPVVSSTARRRTSRASKALLSIEVALSFVLLAGAGLMVNSLLRLLHENPGFRTDGLLTMSVSLPEKQYTTDEMRASYFRRTLQRLERIPGFQSVAAVTAPPLTGDYSTSGFTLDDASRREGLASFQSISHEYFRTMDVAIVAGRSFNERDTDGTTAVAIVNRAFVRKYCSRESVVGKGVIVSRMLVEHTPAGMNLANKPRRVEIVGVVGDIRQLGLDAPSQPEIFFPYTQRPADSMSIVLRSAAGVAPASLAPAARDEFRRLDAALPITDVKTMDEWINRGTSTPRFVLVLVALFGLVAVVLAACGIYGVVAHAVSRRSHELAVRLALGARPQAVVAHIAREHLVWIGAGVLIGVLGAAGATRLLTAYLFGVQPTDTATYAAAGTFLFIVALLAAIVPASRATRIEPAIVLKAE